MNPPQDLNGAGFSNADIQHRYSAALKVAINEILLMHHGEECDAIFLTPSYREHEKVWAKENNVPVFSSLKELHAFKFPPFSELGRKFGEKVATKLDVNEFWRKCSKEEVVKNFEHVAGLGSDPIKVAALALMVWDRKV